MKNLSLFNKKPLPADIDTIKRNFYKMSAVMLVIVILIMTGTYFALLPGVLRSVDSSKGELSDNAEITMRHEIHALSNAISSYLNDYEDAVDTFMYNGAIAYQQYERQYNPTREQGDAFARKARINEFEVFKPDGNLLYTTLADVPEDSLNLYEVWDGYRAIVLGSSEEIKSTMKIRVETGEVFKFTAVPRLDKAGNITGIIESCLNIEGLETQIADFLGNYSQVLSMHLFSLTDGFTLVSVENPGASVSIPHGQYYDISGLSAGLAENGALYERLEGRAIYSTNINRTGVGDSYLLQLEFDERYYTNSNTVVQEQIDSIFGRMNMLSVGSMAVCILIVVALIIAYIINMNRVILRSMEQLAEQTELAEQANLAKSRFLATMSHEIRTPMNAIIGIAQIQLQKRTCPDDELVNALEKIYHSGNTLLGIINDILDMSKIETGKMEFSPTEYDVASLFNDAAQLNMVRIGSKPIEFIMDIDETLPSRMFGDELRLKQILNNLLSNAIKYTEKGYVKLCVKHLAVGDSIKLFLAVEDSGQGMKAEDQEKLFSEYLRFNDEANRATEGTGLGLSITKQLVAMMDGSIGVESKYEKGSTFTVMVIQKAVECEPIGAEVSRQLCDFTFSRDRKYEWLIQHEPMPYGKVLVVDDVETNLYVAEGLLSAFDLQIETAVSGFEAIAKIENGSSYDIIFMDHMMPQMDGIATVRKLRDMGYGGIIFALTANALSGNDEMFKQNGFEGFIAKPIDIRRLNAVLNKFIRDRHPEEVEKYTALRKLENNKNNENINFSGQSGLFQKLLEVFCKDAEKAVNTLRQTAADGDLKLFTITAHAMKSALAHIGEDPESAYALERAGREEDTAYITAHLEDFIKTLESLIVKFTPYSTESDDDISEDTAYLTEKFLEVKTACEAYDDTAAYASLDLLEEKLWKSETAAAIGKVRDMLFLQSDFEAAADYISGFLVRKEI